MKIKCNKGQFISQNWILKTKKREVETGNIPINHHKWQKQSTKKRKTIMLQNHTKKVKGNNKGGYLMKRKVCMM